ncbi:hypothetical protein VOLCADRAFT_109909 [Volvox carteri f. nagariensis]|uniref:UBX domain-containing protein n=1 Tax=Volvox carteri f. nagariensis TaxID=3068 RepID=D8U5N5_VOLCA|nr:uncharacterized protein VOLCADRAFT_109909 [Volvox carteri f. nagariensis]EFJ44950.1 hypothetical protein VOLCADRAFT_109909 [Volvox carteri f. nagariensis]|eukprot:XP_002953921.1 hypothetical protein VOLCADRAFT_109909 [Volvox carteri f. nagariensis]
MANVKSLSDLNGEGEDDKGKFNDYYAGGEKSGQLLRGAPEESDDDEGDRVEALFNRARQAGARAGTSEDLPGQPKAFHGQGRTLGGGPVPSKPPAEGPRNHVITFYNNGVFTVDNGPPRYVDDPANARFIESISKGECPEELETGKHGAPVTVNLMRKEEPYTEGDKAKQYFTGTGRTLGGSSGASTSAAPPPAESISAGEWKGVDESKPTTSLQLRLPDGSRMVARFNHSHTVRDIRRFIRASRPDMTTSYQLTTAFPNKVIEGEDQTLETAGLLNAVIILKQ